MAQRTFSIIKPDAVRKGFAGAILAEIYKAGFQIVAIKRLSISKEQAQGFYYVHKERPFFDDLTTFMSSGPMVLLVLEKDNAIADLRKLMGANSQSGECRGRNDSQEDCGADPGERDSRVGCGRHGSVRDWLLVCRV